jgi:hypothetical protein
LTGYEQIIPITDSDTLKDSKERVKEIIKVFIGLFVLTSRPPEESTIDIHA